MVTSHDLAISLRDRDLTANSFSQNDLTRLATGCIVADLFCRYRSTAPFFIHYFALTTRRFPVALPVYSTARTLLTIWKKITFLMISRNDLTFTFCVRYFLTHLANGFQPTLIIASLGRAVILRLPLNVYTTSPQNGQ
ncbi:MAG: hypothetical protein ACJAUP_000338 [Cellvibrionaceae bacterium]|jgi:hypothetical protein